MKMKHELFFSNLENVGKLYLDYVFFEFELDPLLFTCYDKSFNLYFCHCYKVFKEQRWFVTPVSIGEIQDLINEKIDILTLMKEKQKAIDVKLDAAGKETSQWKDLTTAVNMDDLPVPGTYLRCNKKDALEYIEEKEKQELNRLLRVFFEKLHYCYSFKDTHVFAENELKTNDENQETETYVLKDKSINYIVYGSDNLYNQYTGITESYPKAA